MAAKDVNDGGPSRWKAMHGVDNVDICAIYPLSLLTS